MSRIVVQLSRDGAGHWTLSGVLLIVSILGLFGCARGVRLAPDSRVRPCGALVDPDGRALDRSQVSWMSPDRPNERAKLDAWCRTVGPVVLQRPNAAPPRADGLIVIGWNVHLGAGDIDRLVSDLRSGRIAEGTRALPIVLMLQETFRAGEQVPAAAAGPIPRRLAPRGPRQGAIDAAIRLGLSVYYLPTMRNGVGDAPGTREDRGLAILSSLPMRDFQAIELPLERQRRPAALAVIPLESSSGAVSDLRLVNVHLETRSGARRLWLGSPNARDRQVKALLGSLGGDAPTVIEGDLNTWANRERLLERLGREFTPCTDRRPTFSWGLHLDWFFGRLPAGWTMSCRRLDEKYGSDHYPIVAIVTRREVP
jgi:endonuclease/exonuclease/phosphatase family metal-dependent hydrolase